ncbi:MAG TPA: AAA family ATPase [Bacteroidales bacterium]|jgi:predicted AAA+ superfamily ATPase|nr:AAA family ATPase [Bacteroidales bacterium]HNX84691.1 AAA family ATPase [Bacteroidales bacterium]
MEQLFERYYRLLDSVSVDFTRGYAEKINWNARMIGVRGARGIGKTTILLQHMKRNFKRDGSALYVSLDNIWFSENRLIELADVFIKQGGRYLFLDEVHKYNGWSQELKNIYDGYPDLKIVFTGSSLLEIRKSRADLSRRAVVYNLRGLSFREYLNLMVGLEMPVFSLDDILSGHVDHAQEVLKQVKPLKYFASYLKSGYYPFFLEVPELYFHRLDEIINLILENELPLLRNVELANVPKLKLLLKILAESAPFVPNIVKLSERSGLTRNTVISYLGYFEEAHLGKNLYKNAKGITRLQKPDKIYLENTNLMHALSPQGVNSVNLRETFFVNQLSENHIVEYASEGDFIIDDKFIIETGGKSKGFYQIKGILNSYIASDGIEYGTGNRIPLWLFGFLY